MGVGNPGEGLLFVAVLAVFLIFSFLGAVVAVIILLFGGSHGVAVGFLVAGVLLGIGFGGWLSSTSRG